MRIGILGSGVVDELPVESDEEHASRLLHPGRRLLMI
jgi:hypothetical protein